MAKKAAVATKNKKAEPEPAPVRSTRSKKEDKVEAKKDEVTKYQSYCHQ